ncbi:hypothetical protein ACIBCD_15050 [Nocardia brasiliensis]|uniref:hypothetical protein n=1 Tax=Nocardia brasiliensis TaxID=37326 RepID=UPI0004A6F919|nr:hypothetical protein [Nocardia brasiliensis]
MDINSQWPEATPQRIYYSLLAWCDQQGMTDNAERLRTAGPPPPQDDDGYFGKLAYYQRHPDDPGCARLLAELQAQGPPHGEPAPQLVTPDVLP